MVGGFRTEVYRNRTIEILTEIINDAVDVFGGWLDEVEGSDTVQLFPPLVDVHVQCDVVLAQIYHFEQRFEGLLVECVED